MFSRRLVRILANLIAPLAPLLGACGRQIPVAPPRVPVPGVTLVLPTDRALEFGALERLRIIVHNATPEAVLLDSVILNGQLPVFEVEPVSLPGAIREYSSAKYFVYDTRAPGETPPIFTDGWLLLPGEGVSVEATVRLRFFTQHIQLRYRPIPIQQCVSQVYFARADRRRAGRYRFERVSQSELGFYYRSERGTLDRLAIIPDRDLWPLMATDSSLRVDIRDFSAPGELVARVGASTRSSVTRWLTEGLWIVDDPDARRTLAVRSDGEEGEGTETLDLPRCELTAFDVLDLAAGERAVPVYEAGNPRPVRTVTAETAIEFLKTLAGEGRTLRAACMPRGDAYFDYGLLAEPPDGGGEPQPERPRAGIREGAPGD